MNDEVLVKVEGVSRKFCRSLKRSLWYGVQDVASELPGRRGRHNELRKNEFRAVDDVSFELKRGECLGLIGPNGASKSTLLKLLNGLACFIFLFSQAPPLFPAARTASAVSRAAR